MQNTLKDTLLKKLIPSPHIRTLDKDQKATTVLFHLAAARGNTLAITNFLHAGCPVDLTDPEGRTALHIAIQSGKTEAVQLLLKNGANIYTKDREGCTSLHYSILNEKIEITKTLLKTSREQYFFKNIFSKTKTWEQYINTANALGQTALHYAASVGNRQMVSILIESGAKIHNKDQGGRTALEYASRNQYDNIAAQLLSA